MEVEQRNFVTHLIITVQLYYWLSKNSSVKIWSATLSTTCVAGASIGSNGLKKQRGAGGKHAIYSPLKCLFRAPLSLLRRYFQAPATQATLFITIYN